jgi:1,6-anhydro-N-acetylmuramate kinase
MDGIDAALVRIDGPPEKPSVQLVEFLTLPYPCWMQQRLLEVAAGEETTAQEINQLHTMLGAAFGEAAVRVCKRGGILPARVSVVGSHGQTIHHFGGSPSRVTRPFVRLFKKLQPKLERALRKSEKASSGGEELIAFVDAKDMRALAEALRRGKPISDLWSPARPCTLQIGEPSLIAERMRAPVVADFRTADMAAGGQGAPLVPMVDYLLLGDEREGRVALNIGGIANITVIPADARPEEVFGFDTGPGNMVIDALVRHFTRGKKAYDAGGGLAARGKVIEPLLARLVSLRYFQRTPPKSAGREQFGDWFVKEFFLKRRAKHEDLLRTATELTARTIAQATERFVFPRVKIHRLIVSGGGAHNRFLLQRLKDLLPQLFLTLSDDFGLPVDAKEAIAFAVLADRTMHGLPGNLPRVTGARQPVVLGKLVRPW